MPAIFASRGAQAAQAIGKSRAKKIAALILGLIGMGLVVVAIGQWKKKKGDKDAPEQDSDGKNSSDWKDSLIGSLQWVAFAVLLLFVAYRLYTSK